MALVERGGSLWLNCSTNCPRPERGGLETSLRRNGTQRGLRWLARQLVDIREPETQPVCFFRCARRTLQARGLIRTFREFSAATLSLYYFPFLASPAPWVTGSSPSCSTLWIPKLSASGTLGSTPSASEPRRFQERWFPRCRATGSCRAGTAACLAACGRELHPEL